MLLNRHSKTNKEKEAMFSYRGEPFQLWADGNDVGSFEMPDNIELEEGTLISLDGVMYELMSWSEEDCKEEWFDTKGMTREQIGEMCKPVFCLNCQTIEPDIQLYWPSPKIDRSKTKDINLFKQRKRGWKDGQ